VYESTDSLFEFVAWHRTFFERPNHTIAQLGLVKGLPAIVVFYQSRHDQLGRLKRREALVAIQALSTTSYLPALARQARVDHLGFLVTAERAIHL
jgi:hypothetical protein